MLVSDLDGKGGDDAVLGAPKATHSSDGEIGAIIVVFRSPTGGVDSSQLIWPT